MLKGFSTIEIITSSVIIFLLILIGFNYYYFSTQYAKLAVFLQNYRFLKIACEKYYIDKLKYANSLFDLFTDPYRDYLPKSLATNFLYSPWGTVLSIKNVYNQQSIILFLYLQVNQKVPSFIKQKMMKNTNFKEYHSEYMVFVLSFIYR